jgi:hypothetical protein
MALYTIWNCITPTTAKPVAVTTGTALKTLLVISTSATVNARVVEWGFRCDAPATASLLSVELVETNVAATVTAHATAGLVRTDAAALVGGDPVTNLLPVGTAATGFTSTDEDAAGTITTTKLFDAILTTVPNSNGYEYTKQFPLGREPVIAVSAFLRIRVHAGVAMNALCYVVVEV